jgi:SlyX protein
MDARIQRLEEKIAYLERHVVEQDKAMLELTEQLTRLRLALQTLRERLPEESAGGATPAPDERPPHY